MAEESGKLKKYKFYLLLLIPLAVYFSFGLQHLAKFETADEHLWMYDPVDGRIHAYWRAIETHNWTQTRINDKPGITLAYISGIGMLFEKNAADRVVEYGSHYRVYNPDKAEEINWLFRLPILIFNGLFSFFFLWALKRLTGNGWLALLASSLILLSPIIVGISQIINPDSLMWVFSTAAILSFLIFLKEAKKKFAVMTAIFLGLALLSKYTSVILVPYFFILIFLYLIYNVRNFDKEGIFRSRVLLYTVGYFSIIAGAIAVFAIMMPAVFRHPEFLYEGTIGFKVSSPTYAFLSVFLANLFLIIDAYFWKSKVLKYVVVKLEVFLDTAPKILYVVFFILILMVLINYSLADNYLGIKSVKFDDARSDRFQSADFVDQVILELLPITYSLMPVVLFSLLYLWIASILKNLKEHFLVLSLTVFLLVFYLAVLSQGLLVHIRYSMILYPIVVILGAIGLNDFLEWYSAGRRWRILLYALVVLVSCSSLWLIRPFYFNYTSFLLPQDRIIAGAWGYGGYEAAQYLNSLPDAQNLTIWTDYTGVCSFFVGRCVDGSGYSSFITTALVPNEDKDIDYVVASRRGQILNIRTWGIFKEKMDDGEKPVWELLIDGRLDNFVRIFELENGLQY